MAFDGTDYEMLPRQVQASALPSLQYSGNTQFAYTDAYLFQPTSDATATVTSNFRVRNLLYPSPGYDEGWSQAEWRNNKNISTFGQETIALGGSGNTYTWASSNYTYDSLLLTYSSSDPIGRIKIDTTDSSGTPIARPLIGVAYTLSTDGKKNRAQLMTPASYCSWTMKVPVYYAGTQNY